MIVRHARADDLPYIVQTWAACEVQWNPRPIGRVKAELRGMWGALRIWVAALDDDADAILGFAALVGDRCLMAYTRNTARRCGVQTAIFREVQRERQKAA